MKKGIGIIIAILILITIFTPAIVHADGLKDSIYLQLTESHTDSQVDINVKLVTNTGISGMTLELVYDKEIFEYKGYDPGTTLSEMDLVVTDLTTNPDLPVKFNWFSQNLENVFSEGIILKLHFNLKPDSPNGDYNIGFKFNNGDIVYTDNNGVSAAKSAVIKQAVVGVSENKITEADEAEEKDNNKTLVVVGIVTGVSVPIIVLAAILIIKKIKKKREKKNWVKI